MPADDSTPSAERWRSVVGFEEAYEVYDAIEKDDNNTISTIKYAKNLFDRYLLPFLSFVNKSIIFSSTIY